MLLGLISVISRALRIQLTDPKRFSHRWEAKDHFLNCPIFTMHILLLWHSRPIGIFTRKDDNPSTLRQQPMHGQQVNQTSKFAEKGVIWSLQCSSTFEA